MCYYSEIWVRIAHWYEISQLCGVEAANHVAVHETVPYVDWNSHKTPRRSLDILLILTTPGSRVFEGAMLLQNGTYLPQHWFLFYRHEKPYDFVMLFTQATWWSMKMSQILHSKSNVMLLFLPQIYTVQCFQSTFPSSLGNFHHFVPQRCLRKTLLCSNQ